MQRLDYLIYVSGRRGLRAPVEVGDGPEHDGGLVQELRPHVQLEERGRGDEELVVVGGDVVGLDRGHEGRHEAGWVEGLEIHDCKSKLVSTTRRDHG